MTTSKTFCFIPAKASSTRLKKKNLLPLGGKPLIYYAINTALKSGLFDEGEVILSTESEEIKGIAEKYGANVPYLRNEVLSGVSIGIAQVVLDFLEKFPKYKSYDSVCIMLPTAPFTEVEDVRGAYKTYLDKQLGSLMTVTETEHSSLRALYYRDGILMPVLKEFIFKRSQELEATYRINGAVNFIKIRPFLETRDYFVEPWGGYPMPSERSIDIDNEEGYRFAQFLMERKNEKNV